MRETRMPINNRSRSLPEEIVTDEYCLVTVISNIDKISWLIPGKIKDYKSCINDMIRLIK